MKIYEYGKEKKEICILIQCTAEPWWVFDASAKEVSKDFHVYLVIADGHDESGSDFQSIEKTVDDLITVLKEKEIRRIDLLYGVSMGGACVTRFLAVSDIPVKKAVIDAGITPYPYPKWICRLISCMDWAGMMLATKCYPIMKLAAPPSRWTPVGEDPEEHYRKIFEFEKKHYSSKTIYNVFYSANNYLMPEKIPVLDTEIEYWYGEEEKKARKNNCAYVKKIFPQTVEREFRGLEHAELILMYPKRFHEEIMRFMKKDCH